MLKLNGGLGTSMGLEKAKSLLPVKEGKTFLDLIAEQVGKQAGRGALPCVGSVELGVWVILSSLAESARGNVDF